MIASLNTETVNDKKLQLNDISIVTINACQMDKILTTVTGLSSTESACNVQ